MPISNVGANFCAEQLVPLEPGRPGSFGGELVRHPARGPIAPSEYPRSDPEKLIPIVRPGTEIFERGQSELAPLQDGEKSPTVSALDRHTELAIYQKLVDDIKAGNADAIVEDAALLAVVAARNGHDRLAYVARNIGNSIGNGSYAADGSLRALAGAAPETAGAIFTPAQLDDETMADPNALGQAYLDLEYAVESGKDPSVILERAKTVKELAEESGNDKLAGAADKIIKSIEDGSFDPVASELDLMWNGATNADLGFGSPAPDDADKAPMSDELKAYNALLAEMQGSADITQVRSWAFELENRARANGDERLAWLARDIAHSTFIGTYDEKAETFRLALLGMAPGTKAAQSGAVTA